MQQYERVSKDERKYAEYDNLFNLWRSEPHSFNIPTTHTTTSCKEMRHTTPLSSYGPVTSTLFVNNRRWRDTGPSQSHTKPDTPPLSGFWLVSLTAGDCGVLIQAGVGPSTSHVDPERVATW